MGLATKKKSEEVFTKKEAELEIQKLIQERLGLLPIEINEFGVYYDDKETIAMIRELKQKGIRPAVNDSLFVESISRF